jgi:hypothetical protein
MDPIAKVPIAIAPTASAPTAAAPLAAKRIATVSGFLRQSGQNRFLISASLAR